MLRTKKVAVSVAFFLFCVSSGDGQPSASNLDFRAIWVVRHSMVSPEEIDRALLFAKVHHFNHVFLQVRGRGEAFYNSQFVIKSQLVSDPQFDPLKYAVEKGHILGLEVHAWINVLLAWSSPRFPESPDHIVNKFPEWMDRSSIGETTSTGDLTKSNEVAVQKYLSPSHPGVFNYLEKVADELISNYDLDGIHLDYIRYGDSDFGYNMAARINFERQHGVDPLKLLTDNGNGYVNNSKDEKQLLFNKWATFRRKALTKLVKNFSGLILRKNPECLITVAVKPNPSVAKNRYFQEWDKWLAEGLVDYVVPMNYATELRKFAKEIDNIYEAVPRKYWPGIIMGVAAYNQKALDTRDKIKYSRVTGISGIAVFSYDAHKSAIDFFLPIAEELAK
ncbi:MAG TPA: family 10 glycosylhydrolase [Candidatus Marinimicrobia bacterium]|nr:family 10 glycosylhydrolase [Candidatus Neomarinimicrobiota bacterium]